MEIRVPGLGDIEEVEVIEICVAVGDQVSAEDAIVVIESDKASMEIPAPAAGVVEALHVELGEQIGEGHLIASLTSEETTADGGEPEQDELPHEDESPAPVETADPEPSEAGEERVVEVLVPDVGDASDVTVVEVAVKPGDEVAEDDLLIVLESDKASMEIAAEFSGTIVTVDVIEGQEVSEGTQIASIATTQQVGATDKAEPGTQPAPEVESPEVPAPSPAPSSGPPVPQPGEADDSRRVYAGPAVRRLARELGVDLAGVTGTGNRGRITKDDVKAYVKTVMQAGGPSAALPEVPAVDFTKFGEIEEVALTRIQKRGAVNLHTSWVNLPHVTQHDDADVTDLEAFRASLKAEAERKGLKLTPLAFIVKACCYALTENQIFNSSLLPDGATLAVKKYVNIGMAVDTPEGLVVPVIRNADTKSIWTLCEDIERLSNGARDKKLSMEDVQGGTFSISSLGAIGGTGFTPIVNAPEVAILGVARLQTKPVWNGSEFEPRKMLPLSLSYDHRVINGADGGRFMSLLTSLLSDVRRLAL